MSITTALKGTILHTIVDKVAKSEPRTTVLGAILAGVVATQIDYNKLLQGDAQQIGNLVAAVVVAVLGYYTNHPALTGKPTP